mmetsp:Transcript_1909/g.6788  ORF Transcript_1909/g.6788 Transcript_1909/m.6788 type:complete len:260 (+) Transcript_1909:485-1264(+)
MSSIKESLASFGESVAGVFGKKADPKELVRKWQSTLRGECRQLDRQIRDIEREEKKVQKSIKEAAKRNDVASCRVRACPCAAPDRAPPRALTALCRPLTQILAKEVVQARRTTSRLYVNKAQMMDVSMQLGQNLATVRAVGHLEKSTEVMKAVNDLIKTPEVMKTMQELSKEMMKAGVIEEMVADAMDGVLDSEDLEEETEEEVQKVLAELAGETVAELPAASRTQPAAPEPVAAEEEEEEDDAEMEALQARLNAVRAA